MQEINKTLSNLDKQITDILTNKNVRTIVIIALSLYILFDIAGFYVNFIMRNNLIKALVAIAIFYLSCRDPTIAIILLITFVLSLRNAPGHQMLATVQDAVKDIPAEFVQNLREGPSQLDVDSQNRQVRGQNPEFFNIKDNGFKKCGNGCGCKNPYLNSDKREDDFKQPAYQTQFPLNVTEQQNCMKKAPSKICSQQKTNPTGFTGDWDVNSVV